MAATYEVRPADAASLMQSWADAVLSADAALIGVLNVAEA